MKQHIVPVAICLLLLSGACGKKETAGKNMEQIQQEQGIPVRVQKIENRTFVQDLTYNAPLEGRESTTVQSMVSDVVTGVLAHVGDRIQAGQLVITFPSNTPAAQFEQATTGFNAAQTAFNRMRNLFADGAISRQDLDNAETAFRIAQANLSASDQMINVRAPIDGVITNIMVSRSERSWPGQDLFTIASTTGFKARVMVPDTRIKEVRQGLPVEAQWQDQTLSGRVSRVALALDPYSRAVPVEVEFPVYNPRVSFGVTARLRLIVKSKPDCVVVQRQHIVTSNDQHFVWVNENGRAVRREIVTGLDNQLEYEVLSGLAPGDQLIVEGLNLLASNARLRVID